MSATEEIKKGKRFSFGRNWKNYAKSIDETKISQAVKSLSHMLNRKDLTGASFLDAGSGSGLFSLAARRMGAKVHSFDFDPDSVECTLSLQQRYYPGDKDWRVEQASVLDKDFLAGLGQFDMVYSWGVLHHTGAMWQALQNVAPLVKRKGLLFIAIYNDQGPTSIWWRRIKRIYVFLPFPLKQIFFWMVAGYHEGKNFGINLVRSFIRLVTLRSIGPVWNTGSERGMNRYYDWVDWIGGYPFEVADPAQIFRFYAEKGFVLKNMVCRTTGHGCNEFVFEKI